jgi:hypothetical protein
VACRRRWLLVSLTACSCALAGCASTKHAAPPPPPRLQHALATRLAREADTVARTPTRRLAGRLRSKVIDAINAESVPGALQEELQGRANALADRPTARRARAFAAWLREIGR